MSAMRMRLRERPDAASGAAQIHAARDVNWFRLATRLTVPVIPGNATARQQFK
jgi:hypothetical protein